MGLASSPRLAPMGMPQPMALLQERFVVRRKDWLTPENPELALQRPLPSEKLSWLAVRPATALRIELAMAMALVTALTLVTATALAMVRAARLMVPRSAAPQWSWWIFPWV